MNCYDYFNGFLKLLSTYLYLVQPVGSQVSQPRNWSEHLMQTSSKSVSSKILTIFSCNWPQDIVPLFLIHRKESSGHSWKKKHFLKKLQCLSVFFWTYEKNLPVSNGLIQRFLSFKETKISSYSFIYILDHHLILIKSPSYS